VDYFVILGVKYDATPEEIKRAYRQKARQVHPDVNDSPGAEDQFRMVSEAYRVLSDSGRRATYVQERMVRMRTASLERRAVRRPSRRRYMHSQISLHIGCLVVGIILIAWVMDRGMFFMGGVSQATHCTAVSWTPVTDGEGFRLTYSAPVPWQAQRAERTVYLAGSPEPYMIGSFPCYHSESTRSIQLEPFEFGNVFRLTSLLPWGILGLVFTAKAGRFFFA
jgi:hypothetical protein